MLEIRPMWRMCRLLKKNRATWNNNLVRSRVIDHDDLNNRFGGTEQYEPLVTQQTTIALMHDQQYQREPRALMNGLIHTYITTYCKKYKNRDAINISTDAEYAEEYTKTAAILQNCINHKPPFIVQTGSQVYLTPDGENLSADYFGLFKYWILEIGTIWAVLVSIVGTLAAVYSHYIVTVWKLFFH
jgi:hypothetical protein